MKTIKTSIRQFLNVTATANAATINIEKDFGDTYYAIARGNIDGISAIFVSWFMTLWTRINKRISNT